jgi:hypothetical protein
MKLTRIAKPLRSVQVRVTLAGDLNSALESYALLRTRSWRRRGFEGADSGDSQCLPTS